MLRSNAKGNGRFSERLQGTHCPPPFHKILRRQIHLGEDSNNIAAEVHPSRVLEDYRVLRLYDTTHWHYLYLSNGADVQLFR